jgi:hypothetical protein
MCNCYLGLNPGYNNNAAGIRWKYRHAFLGSNTSSLKTLHLEHDHGAPMAGNLDEYHYDLEFFGRYYPHPKLQLMINLPYRFTTMTYAGESESMDAFGDLTTLAYYQIANTMTTDSLQTRHRLFAGGGVKFPTGKSSGAKDIDIPMSHHLLPGTGSTDFLAGISYIGKKNRFGWNLDANYKVNGSSASGYRYGNTFNATGTLFYELKSSGLIMLPHAGSAFEQGNKDDFNGEVVSASGGTMVWASAGFDIYYGKFAFGNDFRLPLLSNMAEGMPVDQEIVIISLSYNF